MQIPISITRFKIVVAAAAAVFSLKLGGITKIAYTASLNPGDIDKHQLVLVHPRTQPEHHCGRNCDERREWRKEEADNTHEELENVRRMSTRIQLCNLVYRRTMLELGERYVRT